MQDQAGGDLHLIRSNDEYNKRERIEEEQNRNALLEKYDLHPNQHGLKVSKPRGLGKRKKDVSLGELQKEQSNITQAEELVRNQQKDTRKQQKEEELMRVQREEAQREFSRRRRNLLEVNVN
jgi:hypothetical protein